MATPVTMETPLGARMRIDGREVDYFCGTSYFCLHGHPAVIKAACAATKEFGLGPGTLAFMRVYEDLQESLCRWFGTEDVVLTISGYTGPMVLLQGMQDDFDLIFIDAATHYSSRDAIPTLGKPVHPFRHLDANSLAEELARHVKAGQRPVVVSDGVFPSTGALAPLAEYRKAMAPYDGALLAVDDSHGVGVLGASGRGSMQEAGLDGTDGNHFAGTLSKAFGALGGIVPASAALAAKIEDKAMIMRGASPPPPAAAGAAVASLRLLETMPAMRANLKRNVRHMRAGLRDLGFAIPDTPVPIVSVQGNVDLERIRVGLNERDIVVRVAGASSYSDAPDVPAMRLAVFSEHTPEQIDRLLSSIRELL